jgi:hypothetical protein
MKKTLFKIMGLALTIALLASMIIAVVPAGALSIVSVTPSSTTISASNVAYTTVFTGALNLTGGVDTITETFPVGTSITALGAAPAFNDIVFWNGDNTLQVAVNTLTNVANKAYRVAVAGTIVNDATADTILVNDVSTAFAGAASITVAVGDFVSFPLVHTFAGGSTASINAVATADRATVGTITGVAGIVQFTVPVNATIGLPWTIKIFKITNPAAAGAYSVTLKTSQETTAVTSATYNIGAVGNIAVYNSVGAYLGTFSTFASITAPVNDYSTIKVGPGTYGTGAPLYTVAANYVTIVSTGPGAILIGRVTLAGNYDTLDSLILVAGQIVTGNFATIKNCNLGKTPVPYAGVETLLTVSGTNFTLSGGSVDLSSPSGYADTGVLLNAGATSATISGVAFKTDQDVTFAPDVAVQVGAIGANPATIVGCTFTGVNGGTGVNITAGVPVMVMNSTFTSLEKAVSVSGGVAVISGNTISTSITNIPTAPVGAIAIAGGTVTVKSNTIKSNTGYSLKTTTNVGVTVTGNNFSGNTKGLSSIDAAGLGVNGVVGLFAILNNWGAASGPLNAVTNPTGTGDAVSANVQYAPFLTVSSTVAATHVGTAGPDNWDDSATTGVAILNYNCLNGVVASQKLASNPKTLAPPFPAIQYFDVYSSGLSANPVNPLQINFYATGITTSTQVYFYSGLTNAWVLCPSQGVAGTGAYAWVNLFNTGTLPTSGLQGTAFVLVNGFAPSIPSFTTAAPEMGATTPLTNIPFTWASVTGANKYSIAISTFGDMTRPDVDKYVNGTGYVATGTLTAGTPYFWQVTAWQNDTIIAKSAVGTFTPQSPPSTTTTPQITITTQPAPTITFTQPPSTVITIPPAPAPQQITPAWIWGIIGIGAILVIVVIVLIVRTRRVS